MLLSIRNLHKDRGYGDTHGGDNKRIDLPFFNLLRSVIASSVISTSSSQENATPLAFGTSYSNWWWWWWLSHYTQFIGANQIKKGKSVLGDHVPQHSRERASKKSEERNWCISLETKRWCNTWGAAVNSQSTTMWWCDCGSRSFVLKRDDEEGRRVVSDPFKSCSYIPPHTGLSRNIRRNLLPSYSMANHCCLSRFFLAVLCPNDLNMASSHSLDHPYLHHCQLYSIYTITWRSSQVSSRSRRRFVIVWPRKPTEVYFPLSYSNYRSVSVQHRWLNELVGYILPFSI